MRKPECTSVLFFTCFPLRQTSISWRLLAFSEQAESTTPLGGKRIYLQSRQKTHGGTRQSLGRYFFNSADQPYTTATGAAGSAAVFRRSRWPSADTTY